MRRMLGFSRLRARREERGEEFRHAPNMRPIQPRRLALDQGQVALARFFYHRFGNAGPGCHAAAMVHHLGV